MLSDGPIVASHPGALERLGAFVMMFVLGFGLPQDWTGYRVGTRDLAAQVEQSAGGDTVIMLLLLVLTGFAASRLIGNGGFLARLIQFEVLLPALLFWFAFSYVWSEDPSFTLRRAAALAIVAFYGYYLVVRFDLREILRLAAFACGIGTLLNYAFVYGLPEYGIVDGEWVGVFEAKNSLGRAAAFCVMVLVLAARDHRRFRTVYWPLVGMNALLVWNSGSKTGLASMVLILGMLAVYTAFRARKTLYGAVALSMLTAIVFGSLWVTANLDFVADILDRDVTLTGRTLLWEAVIDEVAHRPWFGYGYAAFWGGLFSPSHDLALQFNWAPHAHNAVLEYLLAGGLPAALLFLALWVRTAVRSARYVRFRPGAVGLLPLGMTSFVMLASITEAGLISRTLPFLLWVVCIATVTTVRRARSADELLHQDLSRDLVASPS